jgi:hypothetical protein
VILGRGADEGRAADIDGLDQFVRACPARQRILEGIEVDGDQIDVADAMLILRGGIARIAAPRQNAAMNGRMQRLHPPAHDLRETR